MFPHLPQRAACGVPMAVLAVSGAAAGTSGAVVFGSWITSHYADAAGERIRASLDALREPIMDYFIVKLRYRFGS